MSPPLDDRLDSRLIKPKESTRPILQAEAYPGRVWGSLEFSHEGENRTIPFTKHDNKGISGHLGYTFGRYPDCDVLLPSSKLAGQHHFLIYKELEHDAECYYLRSLCCNGTYVNEALIPMSDTVRIQDGDKISYIHAKEDGVRQFGPIFTFLKGDTEPDLTFDSQFELGQKLGAGSFASVYRATEKKSGMVYAVKAVKKTENLSPKLVLSLQREIGTLMSIDHPNLLRVHNVFSEERMHYVVTELARGGELFDRVKAQRRLTEPAARNAFRQVLSGVKYLHDRGIVHRDLKLENILLMDNDSLFVKISDFGLANIVDEKSFLNSMCGTPSYVAPEILRKKGYGKPVDVWGLGIVLYIFLCGFPPFSASLLHSTDEAVNLIQDMLQTDPNERVTVDGALDHPWMHLMGNQGTRPTEARAEENPKADQLMRKIRTRRLYRIGERSRTESESSQSQYSAGQSQDAFTALPHQLSQGLPVELRYEFTEEVQTPRFERTQSSVSSVEGSTDARNMEPAPTGPLTRSKVRALGAKTMPDETCDARPQKRQCK